MVGRKRLALARDTKAARKEERNRLGTLREQMVLPSTRKRYEDAMKRFFDWMQRQNLEIPSTIQELDEALCHFLETLWNEGDPQSWAGDCLSGVSSEGPSARGSLKDSWKLLSIWQRS